MTADNERTGAAINAYIRRRGKPEPPPDEPPDNSDEPGLTGDEAMNLMLRSRGTARITERKEPENGR
jgi:hypothetical protein